MSKKLSMFDIQFENKKLILHAAYYAHEQDEWRRTVMRAKIPSNVKDELILSYPDGDPLNNLLNIASRLLPDFDKNAQISEHLARIKAYVYN